jgi:aspartate carbamoyltransferase regulatory subunit
MNDELKVRKIKDGTVIDHIKRGVGKKVVDILGINGDTQENVIHFPETVILLTNVPSKKLGRKDIVKVENRELKKEEVDKIALIAPDATWNIVRNYKVTKKSKLKVPDVIEGMLNCPNSNCVTNTNEPISSKFVVENRDPIKIRCSYCEKLLGLRDVL